MPEATKNQTDNPPLRCDTCGQVSDRVSRVVVDNDYNRANAPPIWNCPACYQRKNQERRNQDQGGESRS